MALVGQNEANQAVNKMGIGICLATMFLNGINHVDFEDDDNYLTGLI
jgi:hypothetical protein